MRIKIIQFRTYKQYNFVTRINGSQVRIHVRYNSYLDNYYINIDRLINGKYETIINSVMLYTGVNILQQHPELNLGYLYVIPMKTDLYSKDPSASTIQNYIMMWTSNS
ncbi:MAG: hypothetical protein RR342_01080 [Bacilli bacterium]